jgi:hypothetical protein
VRDVRAIAMRVAHVDQPSDGVLFKLVFGHGSGFLINQIDSDRSSDMPPESTHCPNMFKNLRKIDMSI